MLAFVFKNKYKENEKQPDYIVRDEEKNVRGNGYEKLDRKGEAFQVLYIDEE